MLALTLDTSTSDSSVGLVFWPPGGTGWRTLGEERVPGNVHVEQLAPMLERRLREARERHGQAGAVQAVVVGLGPGPYTGLRIGIATAAAYGDAAGLPVHGVCGLDAVAHDVSRAAPDEQDLLVVADAKRREVFWARYLGARRIGPLGVCPPAELPELLDGCVPQLAAGATRLLDGTALQDVPRSPVAAPSPCGLAAAIAQELLSGAAPGPLAPLYLRAPDAKPPAAPAVARNLTA
ncbi:peptidase M22 glycoprotease [Segniliparus rotundus DSM 44985]|uniref:Peptidase M22 glycoprotease n=1 Tax=Segniliparus rotundus (strain ATCC BAA-972 / CDC 1076 / CIP 108378 / DSM 44985 / JCM 13578) TaxID=640132 RepID=D6ZB83_SEGRD|nr:tRNA (adenosine(37)-N6)-threonylcarbamoyltransferase complex dimerization subunit type 1 TsaB [Segniliparus rotundus]ADG96842.1 peptidase M22 glycoprotease [Segniliparus rotundus DSM 44985]